LAFSPCRQHAADFANDVLVNVRLPAGKVGRCTSGKNRGERSDVVCGGPTQRSKHGCIESAAIPRPAGDRPERPFGCAVGNIGHVSPDFSTAEGDPDHVTDINLRQRFRHLVCKTVVDGE
jgi:hypothetical protein